MTKFERLKKIARAKATARGHSLDRFIGAARPREYAGAICSACFAGVWVDTDCKSSPTWGTAIEQDCRRKGAVS